jgi:hypothetical protein
MTWLVYWLEDDLCVCPWRHGYIGATNRFARRMHQHRERWPKAFRHRIMLRGSKAECLALEARMRPTPGIGWNSHVGGFVDGRGGRGIPKSAGHREKQRQAALRRYADPMEHVKTSVAVRRAKEGIDHSGANNSHFGKPHSEEARAKIKQRLKERGGHGGKNNPNYRHGRYAP